MPLFHPQVSSRRVVAAALAWPLLASAQLGAPLPASVPGPVATEPPPTLEHCAAIGAAPDRLACYDKLAGRAPAEPLPGTAAAPLAVPPVQPVGAEGPGLTVSPADAPSFLSKYWELDAEDKRGTFNFTGYRPNYVLPLHLTSRINRSPRSPTQQAVSLPDYRQAEGQATGGQRGRRNKSGHRGQRGQRGLRLLASGFRKTLRRAEIDVLPCSPEAGGLTIPYI